MLIIKILGLTAASMLLAGGAAQAETPSFIADVIQAHPATGNQTGRIFIAGDKLRYEFQQNGRQMVELITGDAMRMLAVDQRTYVDAADGAAASSHPLTPCEAIPDAACERQGKEKINQIETEKWKVVSNRAPGAMTVWWDAERKSFVRQEFPDGRVMHAVRDGETKYEGRTVEKWTTTYIFPNGRLRRAYRLFDPQLNIAVSERLANGAIREFHNIRVTKLKADLFSVPEGYKKFDPAAVK